MWDHLQRNAPGRSKASGFYSSITSSPGWRTSRAAANVTGTSCFSCSQFSLDIKSSKRLIYFDALRRLKLDQEAGNLCPSHLTQLKSGLISRDSDQPGIITVIYKVFKNYIRKKKLQNLYALLYTELTPYVHFIRYANSHELKKDMLTLRCWTLRTLWR